MSNIASLSTLFGMFAKFLRLLSDLGVAQEHYQNIVNDKMARQNLAEYLVNGCPAIMSGGSPLVYCGKGANPFAEDGLVVISGHHRDNGWVSMGDVNLREPAEDSRTGVLWHRELMDDSSIELANTCLMAHLLVFQNEIPPSWDGKLIFFLGYILHRKWFRWPPDLCSVHGAGRAADLACMSWGDGQRNLAQKLLRCCDKCESNSCPAG